MTEADPVAQPPPDGVREPQARDPAEAIDAREHVTGEPRVDRALALLRDVDSAPLADHVAAYDEVHRLLHDALADLDGE